MSLDPPKVMIERSFLDAVLDPGHERHADCVARYRGLVDRYERKEVLLVAVSTDLRDLERGTDLGVGERVRWFLHRSHRGVFAPVEPLYIGRQHRRAAKRTSADDPTVAITLVMCNRQGVRSIATVNAAYNRYELGSEDHLAG